MTKKEKYLDLLERVGWTFVQAFGAFFLLKVTDAVVLDWLAVLYGALLAGGIATVKCLVAFRIGNTDSAAMPETQPPNPEV